MQFYRLIKPNWAKKTLANGETNPDFKEEVAGPNVLEGCDFTEEFLREKNAAGYNVYFFPNHPSTNVYDNNVKHLSGKHIDIYNFVFVDMDLKDGVYENKEAFLRKIDSFEVAPTMTVDSGNGIHVYWNVSDLTREKYVLIQRALLKYFKTDESVWTVLQLMRLPGYNNTKKYKEPKAVNLLEEFCSAKTYNFSDFPEKMFNLLTDDDIKKTKTHLDRIDGKLTLDFDLETSSDKLPPEFIELMVENDTAAALYNNPRSFGDRSKADMRLAFLLYKKDFDKKQAVDIIATTQKAKEKGPAGLDYAALTVTKVYDSESTFKYKSVTQKLQESSVADLRAYVNGPNYLDSAVLGKPWRRQELLGIIAGSGVGKTAFALNVIRHIIANNPDNNDVFVFFTIEMPEAQIIERWVSLVGDNSPLTNRLYVIGNQDEQGMPKNIGLQEIFEACRDIKKHTGRKIGAFVIDHFHIISTHINASKTPNFGIEAEQGTGWGDSRNLSVNQLATQLKSLVKMLDTFGIILSQTTKGKGVGDLPVGKDGSYNNSQFEWIMDRILTIWQPLMRVQHMTDLKFLSWQYVKLREKHKDDRVFEHSPHLLRYDMDSGNLEIPTSIEFGTFTNLLPKVNEIREAEIKKKEVQYSIQLDLAKVEESLKQLKVVQ